MIEYFQKYNLFHARKSRILSETGRFNTIGDQKEVPISLIQRIISVRVTNLWILSFLLRMGTLNFLDKNNLSHYDVYDIGPMYGFNMMHYGTEYKGMNENYDGKGFNQLNYVLNLIKNDPNSRRIIMSTFNPGQASQGVLYPCHGLITQFYVTNGKLHLVTYQR